MPRRTGRGSSYPAQWGRDDRLSLAYVRGSKECIWVPAGDVWLMEELADLYCTISSALLLYRLCATFPLKVDCSNIDRYKCIWTVNLTHKATGFEAEFGEHKAAVLCAPGQIPPPVSAEQRAFTEDLKQLVTYLCSPECLHTYDGCVAGSVA